MQANKKSNIKLQSKWVKCKAQPKQKPTNLKSAGNFKQKQIAKNKNKMVNTGITNCGAFLCPKLKDGSLRV